MARLRPPAPGGTAAPVLDSSQQAVVDHGRHAGAGPLLVLAGPGTGKTTTLVELVADRVRDGLAAQDILVLTFGRKASRDIGSRIARRIPAAGVVDVLTFHAYCYALVRSASAPEDFADPIRLLTAPEQEWRLAEVLLGATEMQRVQWPEELAEALRTRGVARELADFLSAARSHGLDPDTLRLLAERRGEPVWRSVADLWVEYDAVLSLAREADYAGLVDDALGVLDRAERAGTLAARQPRLLVVDEYQDTDPAQTELLSRLVGPHTELVAVGDPDQSIYAFRGADVRGVFDFADRFGTSARPAATLALRRTRRFGPALLAASRDVIASLGLAGSLSAEQFTAFRHPEASPELDGRIDVRTFSDARAEADQVAATLRSAHVEQGLDYDRMAVLVRGRAALAGLERALRAAGVPVEIAGDEIPLAEQPAVRALLLAARCALAVSQGRALLPEEAEALLLGPLGRLDPGELRTLARTLRRHEAEQTGQLRASAELLGEYLVDPVAMAELAPPTAARLAVVLRAAAERVGRDEPAEQVLWALWDGTSWPRRLSEAAGHGDDAAHRDLDALVALFDDAARSEERGSRATLLAYLDALQAQQIPGDSLAERGTRGSAVRLMTAHRSKGLEWDLVVVAGVQDGVWPATRASHSLLRAERLDPRGDGRAPSFGALLAEERRLFYVAVTRARRHLVVTAVQSMASDGDQPSRFHEQLRPFATDAVPDEAPVVEGRPARPVSLRGVVTELRRLAESGATEAVRATAAARLADVVDLVPAAHPSRWWGVADVTRSEVPVRPVDAPLELSGTAVDGITGCALRWFLSREAKGERGTSGAQGFGLAVHVLAAELIDDPAVDTETLVSHLDAVWHRLDFDTDWIAASERAEATDAVRRLVRWHRDRGDRVTLGAECEFTVEVPVGDDLVRLRGSMDRVEVDAEGRLHVVDFKTGAGKPTGAELATHAQLGVYQLAVAHGGFPESDRSGGAELVHLRQELAREPGQPVVQRQPPPEPDRPFFAVDLLRRSRDTVREERFHATTNARCATCAFRRCCPAVEGQATVGPEAGEGA